MTPLIEALLREVGNHVHPPKERTLFSLGGKGYYENPASDMLAFFLHPDAEHGFKSLFLEAFFDCMEVNPSKMSFKGVNVDRESETPEGSRIDLLVDAPDWVLVIENKVYHAQVNPFESYETFARGLRGGNDAHLAVLSPTGQSTQPGWKGVSYKDYCSVLRKRLSHAFFENSYSKWQVFAREFILHLENELYNPVMTLEQAAFVEKNAQQIAQVQKLASEYKQFLLEKLKQRLEEGVPGHTFSTKDEGWGIRCYCDEWGRSNLTYWTSSDADEQRFHTIAYAVGISEEQRADVSRELVHLRHWRERAWMVWATQHGFDSREEAIDEMCRIGRVFAKLFQAPPAPTTPT